jgi:poly(3-hydroxybutyrate) depolymerase
LPVSTTANRPAAPEVGMMRYNTSTSKYETYSGSAWENLRPTAGGGIGFTSNTYSVAAGSGLTQETNGIAHADTSSQASSTNSGGTVIQSVSVDGFGHITSIGTTSCSA